MKQQLQQEFKPQSQKISVAISQTPLNELNLRQLDHHLKSLARQERQVLCQVIKTIQEISARRSYLDLGYPNLYTYLVEGVGYSSGSAHRRIDAARLMHEIPELAGKIESGDLKLTQVSLIQKATRQIFNETATKVCTEQKREILNKICKQSFQKSEQEVARYFDRPVLEFTKQSTQSDGSVRLELTLSQEVYENIQKAQALVSHAVPSKDLVQFLKYVSSKIIQQKTKVRVSAQKVAQRPDAPASFSTLEPTDSFSIQEPILRSCARKPKIKLDGRRPFTARQRKLILAQKPTCEHVDPVSHLKCNSTWFLQIDHKHSQWAGGVSQLSNAQVLCAAHNRQKYRKEAGLRWKSSHR